MVLDHPGAQPLRAEAAAPPELVVAAGVACIERNHRAQLQCERTVHNKESDWMVFRRICTHLEKDSSRAHQHTGRHVPISYTLSLLPGVDEQSY
jgi:hypothetical protein